MKIDYLDEVLEEAIRNGRKAAIKNLDGIQAGGIMLEGIGEVFGFVLLGRDLAGSSEETMKVSMRFGKNRVVLSW
jgi:hypothetical protein